MKPNRLPIKCLMFLTFAAASVAIFVIGCSSTPATSGQAANGPTTKPMLFGFIPPAPEESGVQLWADNCERCHNLRPAAEYSDDQWAAIVNHMRLRADLTGEEQRKITQFLQASR